MKILIFLCIIFISHNIYSQEKILYHTADSLFIHNDYYGSLDIFHQLVNDNPYNSNYYYHRALCLIKLNRRNSAIDDLEKSIEYNPNNYLAYLTLGHVYSNMNIKKKSSEYYIKSLRCNPKLKATIFNKTEVFTNISNLSEFLQILDENEEDPDNILNKAIVKELTGDLNGSLYEYNKLINHKINIAYFYRGELYIRMHKKKEAYDDFRKYINLHDNTIDVDKYLTEFH